MPSPADQSAIPFLVLVRLLPPGDKGETRDKVAKDLKPLVSHRWEGAAWEAKLDQAIRGGEVGGSILSTRKGKAVRLALTAKGRRAALEGLGLDALPPKTTWAKLKSPFLLARALNADAKRLAGASGLKVELLRQGYGLQLGDRPTLKQATDALAGKLMGLDAGQPFTTDAILGKLLHDAGIVLRPGQKPNPKAIQEALLRRELGDSSVKNPVDILVARSVGARQNKAAELADAALRGWIDRTETKEAPTPLPLDEFARRVVAAARSSLSGWFGDGKVFIAHVWKSARSDPSFPALDLDAFKARLVEAHHARRLELGRADLVAAMDPADVRESATPDLNAVYHFVRTD